VWFIENDSDRALKSDVIMDGPKWILDTNLLNLSRGFVHGILIDFMSLTNGKLLFIIMLKSLNFMWLHILSPDLASDWILSSESNRQASGGADLGNVLLIHIAFAQCQEWIHISFLDTNAVTCQTHQSMSIWKWSLMWILRSMMLE